jgi:murein DD-endopeptidase MepM/ murein hydrolase activator NlpD
VLTFSFRSLTFGAEPGGNELFAWPVDPTNSSAGHYDFCEDWRNDPQGCYWLTDTVNPKAANAWRDAQPFLRHQNKENHEYHLGADYNLGGGANDKDEPVYPTAMGIVSSVQSNVCGWGNIIFVKHDTSIGLYTSMYAHVLWLEKGPPLENTSVSQEIPIAKIGNGSWDNKDCPGKKKGDHPYHLHFEIREGILIHITDVVTVLHRSALVHRSN